MDANVGNKVKELFQQKEMLRMDFNINLQGVFLTGTPLKSSKYKKVNLG